MFSICCQIVNQGELVESLEQQERAEAGFTAEIGVLDRRFFQCVQQPHVIWACTEWTTEQAHNTAAEGLMEVRKDDRVASAYFRPGLYFEVFGRPVKSGGARWQRGVAGCVLVCHGLVADRAADGWATRIARRIDELAVPDGLMAVTTYENIYARHEFVAFVEWRDEAAYEAGRLVGDRTVEEYLFVEDGRSDLAAYTQYECAPLRFTPAGASS